MCAPALPCCNEDCQNGRIEITEYFGGGWGIGAPSDRTRWEDCEDCHGTGDRHCEHGFNHPKDYRRPVAVAIVGGEAVCAECYALYSAEELAELGEAA